MVTEVAYLKAKARIDSDVSQAGDQELVDQYEIQQSEPSGGGFYSAAASTLDDISEPQGDLLTNFYKRLYSDDLKEKYEPGSHMHEWEKYIKPNAPSTDMYHQMAMYNMLDKKLPQNKWLRKLSSIGAIPLSGIGSFMYDPAQAYLDHSIDVKKGTPKGSFLSYIVDQNPFPQAWNRMKGATQFAADELGLPMGREGSDRNEFRKAYNQTVEIPRNMERTLSRFDPSSGNIKAYGLKRGGTADPQEKGGSMNKFLNWWLNRQGWGGLQFRPGSEASGILSKVSSTPYEFEELFLGLDRGGIASLV